MDNASNNTSLTDAGIDLVVSNIIQQYPGCMSFGDCARIIGYQKLAAAHTARARGAFPVRVRQVGGRLVVFTSDLIEYLQTGKSQADQSCAPIPKKFKKKAGRPTKRETLRAHAMGQTVRQLRAYSREAIKHGLSALDIHAQASLPCIGEVVR